MTKATYKRIEHDGRYYFHDGTGYFLIDTGMRMAVMDDRILTEGKPCLGTIHEWIAPLRCSAEAPYYSAVFEFADGLRFEGHAEFDYSNVFLAEQRRYNRNAFDAFFGIELFRQYDLFILRIPGQEGLAIIKRA